VRKIWFLFAFLFGFLLPSFYISAQQPLALLGNHNGTLIPFASSATYPVLSSAPTTAAYGYNATGVAWGQVVSGIVATGNAGQTCLLTAFNNSSTAAATVYLTGVNTIAPNTPIQITSAGSGATAAPTTASAGNGTATCSGVATILTGLGAYVPMAVDANGNLPSGGSISLTTNGTSGAATLTGAVLNIPVYSGGGGNLSGTLTTGQGSFAASASTIGSAVGNFYCDAYASLTACISAAETYAVSGHAASIFLTDHTYTIPSPITVTSGMRFFSLAPARLVDCAANLGTCESPNGGSWISCATACFVAPGTGTTGTNNVSFDGIGFENWTGTAIQFGSATTVGLNSGYFHNIYFYGTNGSGGNPPGSNVSDTAIALYNSQIVPIDNVTAINVNTLLTEPNVGSTGSIAGNAVLTGLSVQTYCKSVALGNTAKPGIFVGSNLVTLVRPQVNQYCGDTGVADGILVSTTGTTIIGADLEGTFLNGVHLLGAASTYVDVAESVGGMTNTITADSTSTATQIQSESGFTTLSIDPAAVATTTISGQFASAYSLYGFLNGTITAKSGQINGVLGVTGLFNAATSTSIAGINNFGNYNGGPNGVKVKAAGGSGTYPEFLLCNISDSTCASLISDYFGSYNLSTGAAGYGLNIQSANAGRDGFYFRNNAGNVIGAFAETAWTNSVLGTFDTTHNWLTGNPFGFWNGTNKGLFAATITAARTWTMPDVSGTVALTSVSNAITSATGGSGITSVTCATAACTNLRGTYTVVGGTATTGTIITLVWPTTTTAYVCTATQNDTGVATAYLGLGHSVATATGMTISAGISVIGTTFNVDYTCQP
jgi:hypothetical protein